MLLEICANSIQSAINATRCGIARIELCQNLNEGGTTPSYGNILYCAHHLAVDTNVLIRPRTGNFCYSDEEFEVIKEEILLCKKEGINGIVVGFLLPDHTIDVKKTSTIVELAYPMEVTFHRAFDLCICPQESLEKIISCGCKRILTSGQKPTAEKGIELITQMVQWADDRIIIMPGGGVNAQNIVAIIRQSNVSEIHASCKKKVSFPTDTHNNDVEEYYESDPALMNELLTLTQLYDTKH